MRAINCILFLIILVSCTNSTVNNSGDNSLNNIANSDKTLKYGLEVDNFVIEEGKVKRGDVFGNILQSYGVSYQKVLQLSSLSNELFDVKKINLGNNYELMFSIDTLGEKRLEYFIYEVNNLSHLLFATGDSLYVRMVKKEITHIKRYKSVTINTSLWVDVEKAGISGVMALKLSDIYDCTIDFFGLQKGDSFNVVYDEMRSGNEYMGIGNIYYAEFTHAGKVYDAIRFNETGLRDEFWSRSGESLKKAFLKAPLNYTRISSGFTYARKHPILKIVRPHTGVDYAAPSGTPVVTIGDGVVIFKGWTNGGGNTLKIKHNSTYTTSYMHLKGFAKGITKGSRVAKGDLIGYVGSTGLSSGPHLDFRVYKNGTPINPLKMESPSVKPISKENMQSFKNKIEQYKYQRDSIKTQYIFQEFLNLL